MLDELERKIQRPRSIEYAGLPVGLELHQALDAAPTLEQLGRVILDPSKRPDHDLPMAYTSLANSVEQWAQNPYDQRLGDIANIYGIPQEHVQKVLLQAGMGEYLHAKQEGRFVSMISAQILRPNFYYLANALLLNDLHNAGIPTAFMVLEYPEDTFVPENTDKGKAFQLEIPVGIERKVDGQKEKQVIRSIQMKLEVVGVADAEGVVQHVDNMNQAKGRPCNEVYVKIADVVDHNNKKLPNPEDATAQASSRALAKMALGIDLPNEAVSLTDFYKILWKASIKHLRDIGELPSEEDMPMFYVNQKHLYETIARFAQLPQEVSDIVGFSSYDSILRDVLRLPQEEVDEILDGGDESAIAYLQQHHLYLGDNGLLMKDTHTMDPSSYYMGHMWADAYAECSSCASGDPKFQTKVYNAQAVRNLFEIPIRQVRLFDIEFPELEQFIIGPGKFIDTRQHWDRLTQRRQQVKGEIDQMLASGGSRREAKANARQLYEERMTQINQQAEEQLALYAQELVQQEQWSYAGLTVPPAVATAYKQLLVGLDAVLASSNVQARIKEVRK